MTRVAILDDYQNVALDLGDWASLPDHVELTVFNDHLVDEDAVADRLDGFEIVIMNCERTPFPGSQLEKMRGLKLLVTSGMVNRSIDLAAAAALGITVCGTRSKNNATPELTWGLIISLMRNIPREDRNVRAGGWQTTVGRSLKDSVLGIVGLGRLGTPVARIGQAFGMEVIAWSPNLTPARTAEAGVECVTKEALFSLADVITIHMPLSERSRGIIQAEDIARMKPTAYLVNTSRGPLIDEAALIAALQGGQIGGAAIDVYDIEPLPADHPIRSLDNTVLTPHLGYVIEENYRLNFADAIADIAGWFGGNPLRVLEP